MPRNYLDSFLEAGLYKKPSAVALGSNLASTLKVLAVRDKRSFILIFFAIDKRYPCILTREVSSALGSLSGQSN